MDINSKKSNGNKSGNKQPVVIVIAQEQSQALEWRNGIYLLQGKKKFAIDEKP